MTEKWKYFVDDYFHRCTYTWEVEFDKLMYSETHVKNGARRVVLPEFRKQLLASARKKDSVNSQRRQILCKSGCSGDRYARKQKNYYLHMIFFCSREIFPDNSSIKYIFEKFVKFPKSWTGAYVIRRKSTLGSRIWKLVIMIDYKILQKWKFMLIQGVL